MEEEQVSEPGITDVQSQAQSENEMISASGPLEVIAVTKQPNNCAETHTAKQDEILPSDYDIQRVEKAQDVEVETDRENEAESKLTESKQENDEDQNMSENQTENVITIKTVTPRKAKKRGIFVSYSSDASFEEKRFISYTVKELKNLGFSDEVWFDKDEGVIGSPHCFQQRLEIVERCRAALVFLSHSYLDCKLCRRESSVLLSRNKESDQASDSSDDRPKPVRLFCINYNLTHVPADFRSLDDIVHLNSNSLAFASIAEKSSAVVAAFSESMEKYALLFGSSFPAFVEQEGSYKKRKVHSWDVSDVQDWLNSMKIHQRFCLSFEENQVDGFLLLSVTESDLESHLMVDSKVARRKLQQQLKGILEKENLEKERWFMKLRKVKVKDDSVYIIYDPTDMKFMERLRIELVKRNVQVHHHERLGQSKDEFLQLNGAHLAASSQVILIMSEESAKSLFVYNELLFADWLDKPFVVAMVENSWNAMRLNMQALLGSCSAVEFETKPFHESFDVLLYHVKPFRNMPAVILEQEFLDRMVDGIKPLRTLVNNINSSLTDHEEAVQPSHPKIFLSYHWDVQSKVERLAQYLETQGFDCWTDVNTVTKKPALSGSPLGLSNDNLLSQIQRKMKSSTVVVCCITQKYICSDNCSNDLRLADSLSKPIVPLMFQWMSWPPESVAVKVRKILAPLSHIDLSNEKLLKKNLNAVISQLTKHHNVSHFRQGNKE